MVKCRSFLLIAVLLASATLSVVSSVEEATNQKTSSFRKNENSRKLGLLGDIQGIFAGGHSGNGKNKTNTTSGHNNGLDLGGFIDGVFGLFDGKNKSETENTKNETNIDAGWLGGFLGNITDAITNITDGLFSNHDTMGDGLFNGSLFGSNGSLFNHNDTLLGDLLGNFNFTNGGVFDVIFNGTDGGIFDWLFNSTTDDSNNVTTIINSLFDALKNITNKIPQPPQFNGFLSEWEADAVVSKTKTCQNAASAPECYDPLGQEGFWVCRTLSNPFTGTPSSKDVCISKGQFLSNNDECGCCIRVGETVPTCPKVCECTCKLNGNAKGVLVNVTTVFGNTTMCVDTRWAVSSVDNNDLLTCDDSCKKKN